MVCLLVVSFVCIHHTRHPLSGPHSIPLSINIPWPHHTKKRPLMLSRSTIAVMHEQTKLPHPVIQRMEFEYDL